VGADDLASPEAVLAEKHGLVKLGERLWVLPREIELREKLGELPKRRERIVTAEKELETAVQTNARVWQETRPAIAVLEQSLARLATGDPQRPLIERQIAGLASSANEPARLGGKGDVRKRIVELSAERCGLLADAAWIREAVPQLKSEYGRLAANAEVATAIKQSNRQRLGPQRRYEADLDRLNDYEALAATRWTPIFEQSGQTRLTALVDERSAVTFTWSEASDQPVVLTASAAEAIGLEGSSAARETILAAPGRKVAAQPVTLRYVRLGRCVLRGVPAYVLPPEAEDIGNRLGRTALIEHRVRMEPERVRMWIDE
jgi:hypothetical protein